MLEPTKKAKQNQVAFVVGKERKHLIECTTTVLTQERAGTRSGHGKRLLVTADGDWLWPLLGFPREPQGHREEPRSELRTTSQLGSLTERLHQCVVRNIFRKFRRLQLGQQEADEGAMPTLHYLHGRLLVAASKAVEDVFVDRVGGYLQCLHWVDD